MYVFTWTLPAKEVVGRLGKTSVEEEWGKKDAPKNEMKAAVSVGIKNLIGRPLQQGTALDRIPLALHAASELGRWGDEYTL